MRSDIEFQSEGVTCRGWLYVPERHGAATRVPAIVMALEHKLRGVFNVAGPECWPLSHIIEGVAETGPEAKPR